MGTLKLRDQANAAWIALRGPRGLKGDKGDKGDTGDTGPTGPAGTSGALVKIGEVTTTADSLAIDFSGIPDDYTELRCYYAMPLPALSLRLCVRLNDLNTARYAYFMQYGTGTSELTQSSDTFFQLYSSSSASRAEGYFSIVPRGGLIESFAMVSALNMHPYKLIGHNRDLPVVNKITLMSVSTNPIPAGTNVVLYGVKRNP